MAPFHSSPQNPIQQQKAAAVISAHTNGGKSCDQPGQHIKKQRHHFADKGPSSQGYGFPVVMYGCESWTIKKAERQRMDAFELWC